MVRISKDKYSPPVLKAGDLGDDIILAKIVRYGTKELPQTGETDCVWFEGYEMPLALNKTNMKMLVELFGDESDQWTGKTVKLVKAMANNPQTGQDQEVIRIKAYEKKKA